MTFSQLVVVPVTVTLVVITVQLRRPEANVWGLGGALLGAVTAAASPWVLTWYTRNILGDNTANIGAGLLMMAQPVLVPIVSVTGLGIGLFLKMVVDAAGRRDTEESGEVTGD